MLFNMIFVALLVILVTFNVFINNRAMNLLLIFFIAFLLDNSGQDDELCSANRRFIIRTEYFVNPF